MGHFDNDKLAKEMTLLRVAEGLTNRKIDFLIDLAARMRGGEEITVEQAIQEYSERTAADEL